MKISVLALFYTFLDIMNDNKNIKYSLLFLDIIGRTMKLLLLVVICIVIFGAFNAEARIMGGGGGRRWRVTAPPRFKPWDSHHRYEETEEDREFWDEQDEAMKDKYQNGRYGNRGCVGLCLYNKI